MGCSVPSWLIPFVPLGVGFAILLALAGCVNQDMQTSEDPELATIVEQRIPGDMMQMPDYPAGCEIVSLINTVKAFGVYLTFEEAYQCFDISINDFVNAWWGDPYTVGAAYPPAMTNALNRALDGTPYHAVNLSFGTIEDIFEYVKHGGLIVAWFTTDYEQPRFTDWVIQEYRMYQNEHCIVVYDISGGEVKFMDPLQGNMSMDVSEWKSIWTACGTLTVGVI